MRAALNRDLVVHVIAMVVAAMSPVAEAPSAPQPVRLSCFGRFRVDRPAGPVHLPARVASLLCYIALHPRQQARSRLAALLWGDVSEEQARHSLRTALHVLRAAFGDQLLVTDRESVQLNPEFPLQVDVWDFERQAKRLPETSLGELHLIELYQGALLQDLDDEWIVAEREHYSLLYQDALLQATQCVRAQSEYDQAITLAHAVLAQDPANERAHQHLMFCYALSGDRSLALRQYETCRQALRSELDVEPSPQTEMLHRWIKQTRPRLRKLEALVTNLPVPLTSFIGRKEELAQLVALLARGGPAHPAHTRPPSAAPVSPERPRLVTLTGAGGSGKTRLAIQAGLELTESFADGVWWVDLAPLAHGQLVLQAVARALGIRERSDEPLIDTVTRELRHREFLLVLDNCEHLIGTCTEVASSLLAACPDLTILATSRIALGVSGEKVWQVPTLAVPDPDHLPNLAALREFEAVQLFLDRANTASTFMLSAENADSVARICAQLDGIPLAIELAAGRLKVLAVQQIAERLVDRFGLLTDGSRSSLPRHRTLRAAIEWSYDLLSEQEQRAFEHLSVFAGGWTLEAAEAVCLSDSVQTPDILSLLAQLVDKSLVLVDTAGAEARYHLLETLRQYGGERLNARAATADVRALHAQYFAEMCKKADVWLHSSEASLWLDRLESEHNNLRAAMAWVLEHSPHQTALDMAGALIFFWSRRGYLREGHTWLERLLACSVSAAPAQRVKVLVPMGWFARVMGDYARAIALNDEAADLCRQTGDRLRLIDVLIQRGTVAMYGNDLPRALACFEEGAALAQQMNDRLWRVVSVFYWAHCAVFSLKWSATARQRCEETLAVCRELRDRTEEAHGHIVLGMGAHLEGRGEEARQQLEQAVALCRQAGDKRQLGWSTGVFALILHSLGRWAEAVPLAREAVRLGLDLGEKTITANAMQWCAILAVDQGQIERATRLMGFAYAWWERIGFRPAPFVEATLAPSLGAMRGALGDAGYARAWAEGAGLTLEQATYLALS